MKEISITIKFFEWFIDIQVFHFNRGAIFYRYYPQLTPEVKLQEFIARIVSDMENESKEQKK